jgi:hypothetical protein
MRWMILILVAALAGCSNRKEVILSNASRPAIGFGKDTVRVREQDWTNVNATSNGKVTFYLRDAEHAMNMQVDDTSSRVHIMYRGNEIKTGESIPVLDSVLLYCVADAPGLYEVTIWLTDRLGRIEGYKLFIRCVANVAPKALFFWRDLGSEQLQTWNYGFDASNSNDPDGIISEYHYSINGQSIVTNQPLMNWAFHAKGQHTIGLHVIDELGKSSDTLYQNLTIQ